MSMVADLTKHLFSLGPEAIEESQLSFKSQLRPRQLRNPPPSLRISQSMKTPTLSKSNFSPAASLARILAAVALQPNVHHRAPHLRLALPSHLVLAFLHMVAPSWHRVSMSLLRLDLVLLQGQWLLLLHFTWHGHLAPLSSKLVFVNLSIANKKPLKAAQHYCGATQKESPP